LDEVFKDARANRRERLTIIAGDLNLDASKPSSAKAIARDGFIQATPADRLATIPPRRLFEPGRHIDWAFVRGAVQIKKGRVHNSIKASDHYPISFEIGLPSEH
jgi:endonuclease/exonuclease/phosphatase family metal-dependent hydrolase